jgi:sigma-E factor negative regulatory protein RseC
MTSGSVIRHKGIVNEWDGKQVRVSIIAHSACSSCRAKGACGLGESQEKFVEVSDSRHFSVGEEVMVNMEQSLGTRAVLLGYFFPFLVLFISLVLLIQITGKEGMSALISFMLLVPYYLILYFMRDRLKKTFSFRIEKNY